jgi:hypothetical protein
MLETDFSPQSSLLESIKNVIHAGVDYFMSSISLLQARMTGMALSAVVFIVTILVCVLLALASLVLLTVALGIWLSKATGSPVWALIILGSSYLLISGIVAKIALGSLKKMNSDV